MRLGIDYRLLASRENLVNRGIGRYTQQQLQHVLRLDTGNEYLLLCPPGSDTSLVLPEIRSAPNVSFRYEPAGSSGPPLRRSAAYQDWIHSLDVDLYHSTAPFFLEQTAPPAFDACPMVATVYDLIPLIFPSEYLREPRLRAAYAGAARLVSSATRLLAISDGTRDDAAHYLGFPRGSIDCAWPFADACFRPLSDEAVSAALDGLALPDRFVLTVAALHHTKNLELLFAAYARLSPWFRRALPLVVACHLDEAGVAHMRRWAATYGVADDVVLTGYVPDRVLAALYNRATLVAHPSRYEGFGLPVVEAMQCAAAVVTTTAPSLPEISGGAAALVDPDDAGAMAAAIEALSSDPGERARMGEAGVVRAAAFTPGALAEATLACYRATVAPVAEPRARRVAVRTLEVARVLPAGWDVHVFTDDDQGPLPDELLDAFPVHHAGALDRVPVDLTVEGDLPARPRRPSRLDVLVARGRLGWTASDGLIAVEGDATDDEVLACDVVVDPALALRAAAFGKPLVGTNELPALADDPAELERRSEAAHQWFEGDLAAKREALLAPLPIERPPAQGPIGLNKLREVEDLDEGADWPPAMSLRALATGDDQRILWLGAYGAAAALDLTNRVAEVTLAGPWLDAQGSAVARALVLDPALVAAGPFDPSRLLVRPADPRRLPFPSDSFDSVVACRATDCLTPEETVQAVAEAVRVVRPGGVVAISVLVRLHGPAGGPGVPLEWAAANLVPAGVELLDPLRTEMSDRTMTARRQFARAFGPPDPRPGEPPLTLSRGAVLACLHLAMRRAPPPDESAPAR